MKNAALGVNTVSLKATAETPKYDGVLLVVVLAVVWQVLHWLLGREVMPSPVQTLKTLSALLSSADFLIDVKATAAAFFLAFSISAFGGVALGISLGVRRFSADVMEPVLVALYSIPKIALYPVILLAFGLGLSAKVAFGAIHGLIPVALFSMTAIRNIPPVYLRTARACRAGRFQTAFRVVMPAAMPEIVAGLRIGFSLTLLGTLVGEMFASQYGIGHRLMRAIERSDAATIMALALILFLFAVAASLLLLHWDKRLRHGADAP